MSTKTDFDFDTWFENLQIHLLDQGIDFADMESVRQDYEDGKDFHDVYDEIVLDRSA